MRSVVILQKVDSEDAENEWNKTRLAFVYITSAPISVPREKHLNRR